MMCLFVFRDLAWWLLIQQLLYRAGDEARWLFIVVAGECIERVNCAIPQKDVVAKKLPEKKVNVDLLLVGPGDMVGEQPFVKNTRGSIADIKAVTDVSVLAIEVVRP